MTALTERADAMVSRVLDDMYQDPFWDARYGERGRKYTREDGHYHLQYLRQAVVTQSPAALIKYAGWLRTLLVSRGMCSNHLIDNFERLSRALDSEGVEERHIAQKYLAEAVESLRYRSKCSQLLDALLPIARESGEYEREINRALGYLSDAVGEGHPPTFAEYIAWNANFLKERGKDVSHVLAAVACIRDAAKNDEELVHILDACLTAARELLGVR